MKRHGRTHRGAEGRRLLRLGLACAGWTMASAAVASASPAPRVICYPVVHGDTVTAISARLTQYAGNWREPGFQIFDPVQARFVPKARYRSIQPGWQACVVEPLLRRSVIPRAENRVATGRAAPSTALHSRTVSHLRWWWLTLLCSAVLTALFLIQTRVQRRRVRRRILQGFGTAFIREFERPLIEERGARAALRAQLSVCSRRGSMDVRLAPSKGRTYPNLSDHRANVEYDVHRVISALNDRRFICGPLKTHGEWVTIPVRLAHLRKEG